MWIGVIDRDKVIKGLTCCRNGFCFACPYNDGVDGNVDCKQKWADDVIELLTPVKPIRDQWRLWRCGNCQREIDKYEGDTYCPECGRKVNWGD